MTSYNKCGFWPAYVLMTGIAHGLILDAQQKIADEFKADPDSMRKLRNKHRELTKRRKKNIP